MNGIRSSGDWDTVPWDSWPGSAFTGSGSTDLRAAHACGCILVVWGGGRQQGLDSTPESWAMFTIQNAVEFELWQLDRVGGGIQAEIGSRGKSAGTCVVLVCKMTLAYLASYLVVEL